MSTRSSPAWRGALALKIAFSAALVFLLSRKFSFAAAADHLLEVKAGPVALAFALLTLSIGLSGWRWHFASAGGLSLRECLHFTWIGHLYAMILPGALSGDLAKGVVFKGRSKGQCGLSLAGSIFLDRFAGLGSLAVFGLLSCAARPSLLGLPSWMLVVIAAGGAVLLTGAPWIIRPASCWLAAKSPCLVPLREHALGLTAPSWFAVLLLSCVIQVVNVSFYQISLIAVGGRETWWEMGLYTCLLNLAMLLPVSIGGIGVREQIAVSLFQSSANAPVQIAFAWLVLFLSLGHALIGLALHWSGGERKREANAVEAADARA